MRKSLTYFYPSQLYEEIVSKRINDLSIEMQMYFEQINGDELKGPAINLIKQFAEFDITELVVNSAELVAGKIEHDEELINFHSKRSRRK